MDHLPCHKRTFPFRMDIVTFYATYLGWLRHLTERLGLQNTLSIWKNTFADYDERLLISILSSGWHKVASDGVNQKGNNVDELVADFLSTTNLELSIAEVKNIIENTPPISQIKQYFSLDNVEKEITVYDALHLLFDALACLAESLIEKYGKQGELIVYDLLVESRLASVKDVTGSVEEFIENIAAESDTLNLFTAGLETELINKTKREAVFNVRECEWARYFQERHPDVGYLMACSTDEVAYRAFNKSLRLQRVHTIMEGSGKCDFRIYAIDETV